MFAIGIIYLREKLSDKNRFLILIPVVVIILIHVYYFDIVPLTSYQTFSIPQYSYQVANFINNEPGYFNVGTLPAEYPFGHYANYYYGTDIYSYLINKNVFTGGYVAVGEIGPINTQHYYFNTSNTIQNSFVNNKSYISDTLGKYGIKYIIVQGDTAANGSQPGYLIYNYSKIYANLNTSKNISFVAKYGNTSIYQNNWRLPLLFSNRTYNISYNVVSPVMIKVNTENLSPPFKLYLRETYHQGWIASYSNGTTIPNHINSSYMNEWIISSSGKNITLYYEPQNLINDSWFVAIIALGAVLLLIMHRNRAPLPDAKSETRKQKPAVEADGSIRLTKILLNPLFLSIILLLIVQNTIYAYNLPKNLTVNNTILASTSGITITNNYASRLYGEELYSNTLLPASKSKNYSLIFFYKNATKTQVCITNVNKTDGTAYLLYNLNIEPKANTTVFYAIVKKQLYTKCTLEELTAP